MKIIKTKFKDLFLYKRNTFLDNRGFFRELFLQKLVKKKFPFDVISIQLNALQRNNIPFKDAGIEQVWAFAHPSNKRLTGPLEKFKKMIYSKSYQMLIKHENSEITILSEDANRLVYKIYILSSDKKRYSYIWQIEKVEIEGDLKDCWMTTSVSPPNFLGEVI